MKRTLVLSLYLPCILFGQRTTTPLSSPLSSTGPIARPPSRVTPSELTVPQSQVAPSNLPDRFEFGRQSALTDVHDYQIKDLLTRVSSIENSVNWGRGLFYAIGILLAGLVVFVKAFWKPILRML